MPPGRRISGLRGGHAGSFPSLQARITLSVGIATALILAAFGYIATWVIDESTTVVLRHRLQLAEAVAGRIGESLTSSGVQLEDLAWELSQEPNWGRQQALLQRAGEVRRFAGIAVATAGGSIVWSRPSPWLGGIPYAAGMPGVAGGAAPATPMLLTLPGTHLAAFVARIGRSDRLLIGGVNLAQARMVNFSENDGARIDFEVMDPRGVVVASSQQREMGGLSEHLPVIGTTRPGRAGIVLHAVPGHPHYVAYTPLADYPGWTVNVEQPRDVVLSFPYGLRRQMVLLGLVIAVGMSLLAFLDVRSVVRPLARLREAAGRIAGGDLDHPVGVSRKDEVGTLADAFEAMRVALKMSREEIAAWSRELENRVTERTRELTAMVHQLTVLHEIAQALNLLPLRTVQETAQEIVNRIAAATGGSCRLLFDSRGRPISAQAAAAADAPDGRPASHGAMPDGGAANQLSVPLVLQGREIGTLWLDAASGAGADPAVSRIIASQVAVAVENAELYEGVRDQDALRRQLLDRIVFAQEEERHRIARELHDEIGQALTALVMQVGAAEAGLPPNTSSLRDRLAGIRKLTSATIEEVRRLMLNLRPAVLDDLGLVPAIRWYMESHVRPAGIKARLSVSGLEERERLPRRLELAAFRLVQEAATNVLRHAEASRVAIVLRRRDGVLALSIADNGRGFDVGGLPDPARRGWGLVGMQERVALLGGQLTVTSRPRRGTRITAAIPLGEGAHDN